ncbi:NAD(P)-dependent alcohol dehydrogenase [Mycolicibacterium parafortuitum]|uniref:Dehydrogenase [Nocardia brasiliensis ATCC] n=1 Tax=Mycolicibacterium parafortuitum TaxID=39692 RepID=A0A375YB40_MYCPF|nr:NAD(P)-dependent alcohol dehydrogenase [Mycolicibacterium parafortuitum]ORB31753.1 dehydrogenase [Mycolicibacterium parafortuitum]SRX78315.1 dehydrogenase [Nocardia brasiliensis ATCC] [Mycolicibacterium parafortuitum]
MRAVQLVEPTVVRLVDIPVPEIGPDDVLLRVAAAGVCHSDLHVMHNPDRIFARPVTLGHEVTGSVADVGSGVRGWAVGDSAIVHLCWSCGQCRNCLAGADNVCLRGGRRAQPPAPGLGPDGGMAEYMRVPARFLVGIDGLDPVVSAPLADAAMTAYHAIRNSGHALAPGNTAVVIGVGGLGHCALQILRATTATRIIAVDVDAGKLADAVNHGAHETVSAASDTVAAILDLTDGIGAQAVFDFVGNDATLRTAAAGVAPNGVVQVAGLAGGRVPIAAAPRDGVGWPWGASLRMSYGGTRTDLVACVALARDGHLRVDCERFALADALEAFDRLEAGGVRGRAVLVP